MTQDPKSPPQSAVSVEQLLPCPFCGSDEGLTIGETKCTALVRWWSVECHGCCVSNTANTESEAIAEWNTRAPASAAPPADGVPVERERWESCNCPEAPFDDELVYDSNLSPRCPRCNVALGGDPMTDSARAAIRAEEALEATAQKTPTAPIGEAGEIDALHEALNIMLTAFAGYASTKAQKEACIIASKAMSGDPVEALAGRAHGEGEKAS